MLAIPLKAGAFFDWSSPLHDYLLNTYDTKTANEHLESLTKLTTTRDLTLSLRRSRPDQNGLTVLSNYLRMLSSVELRFPIKEDAVNCTFAWFDAFQVNKRFEYHRLSAERAATLFNLAAMQSRVAVNLDRTMHADLVLACDLFKSAATIYAFLREKFIPGNAFGPVTADMSHEGLKMLSDLMLAQSQVCFYEKAVRNKLSPSVLRKLAAGAYKLYNSALKMTSSKVLKDVLAESWALHLNFQSLCFQAAAEYQMAKFTFSEAERTGEGYGTHIAWLTAAKGHCEAAISFLSMHNLPQSLMQTVQTLLDKVVKDRTNAIDQNVKIYLELVPETSTLPEIEGHMLAKVDYSKLEPFWIGKLDFKAETEHDIFFGLLPVKVEKCFKKYEERVKEMMKNIEKVVDDRVANVRNMLAEANLPMLIEAGGNVSVKGIPDDVYKRVASVVHERGGVDGLVAEIEENKKVNVGFRESLTDCLHKLTKEEEKFKQMKMRFGDRWQIPASFDANEVMKKDCYKFLGYLTEGLKNDEMLLNKLKFGEFKTVFDDLSMEKAGLDLLVPNADTVDDDNRVESLRTKLRMSYINLDELIAKSATKLRELQSKCDQDSVTFIQKLCEKPDFNEILQDQDRIYGEIDDMISNYVEPVSEIENITDGFRPKLARVLEDSAAYMSSREESSIMKDRLEALSRIDKGVKEFEKIGTHVIEGKTFYENLSMNITKLINLISDHCFSREMLANELEEALNNNPSSNVNVNFNDSANMQAQFALQRQKSEPVLGNYAPNTFNNQKFSVQNQNNQNQLQRGSQFYNQVDSQGFPVMQQIQNHPTQFQQMQQGQNMNNYYNPYGNMQMQAQFNPYQNQNFQQMSNQGMQYYPNPNFQMQGNFGGQQTQGQQGATQESAFKRMFFRRKKKT